MTPIGISNLRASLGLTQGQFGRLVLGGPEEIDRPDARQGTVSRWESGAATPDRRSMKRLDELSDEQPQ